MITVYSDDLALQDGKAELIDGRLMPCFEMPRRAFLIRVADRTGCRHAQPFLPARKVPARAGGMHAPAARRNGKSVGCGRRTLDDGHHAPYERAFHAAASVVRASSHIRIDGGMVSWAVRRTGPRPLRPLDAP